MPHSLQLYDSKGGLLYPLRCPLLRAFVVWTRLIHRRLARRVVCDVCGASLEVVASCPSAALTRDVMNERAVLGCRRTGEGVFIAELDRQLRRRGLDVPAFEHDLAAELRGSQQTLLTPGALRTLGALGHRETPSDRQRSRQLKRPGPIITGARDRVARPTDRDIRSR